MVFSNKGKKGFCKGLKLIEKGSIEQGRFDPTPIFTHINHGIDELEKTLWQKKDKEVLKPICLL